MTAQEDKETLRSIMAEHDNKVAQVQYICASEYYSLNDEDKTKIVSTQLDFMNKTRSIFISGIKTIFCNLRLDAMEEREEGDINSGEDKDLASWLVNTKTGSGEPMFTRIHEARNGLVELYMTPSNHKEVIDWARLATSEIAKELSDTSIYEVFIDVQDANNQLATNPDWTPHTLAKRVEHLTPSELPQQTRRRAPVAITYATANSEKPPAKKKTEQAKKGATSNNPSTVKTPPAKTSDNLAWAIASTTAAKREVTEPEKPRETTKAGVNKYKVATAAQDQRMDKIEAAIEAIALSSTKQQEDPRIKIMEMHIESIAKSQCNTVKAINQVIQGQGETKAFVKELTKKVKYNKKQADEDHKIMTAAMKLFHDNLVQLQTMINALQRGRDSPTRKKRATSQQRTSTNSDHDSDESSFNSTKMGPLLAVYHPHTSFQSNANMDNMEGAADKN